VAGDFSPTSSTTGRARVWNRQPAQPHGRRTWPGPFQDGSSVGEHGPVGLSLSSFAHPGAGVRGRFRCGSGGQRTYRARTGWGARRRYEVGRSVAVRVVLGGDWSCTGRTTGAGVPACQTWPTSSAQPRRARTRRQNVLCPRRTGWSRTFAGCYVKTASLNSPVSAGATDRPTTYASTDSSWGPRKRPLAASSQKHPN